MRARQAPLPEAFFVRNGRRGSRIRETRSKLACQAIEDAAGVIEISEELFFGAEFGGMGDEAAAGAAGRMFYVEHLVVEHVFDGDLRDAGMIHAAI